LLAEWLLTAITKIVTGYTQPGHQVLLLTPPSTTGHRQADPASTHLVRTDPFLGLHEAVLSLVQLGRTVHTGTAAPPTEHPGLTSSPPQSGSGPRLSPFSPRPHPSVSCPDRSARPTPPPDRVDAIITAARPAVLDWVRDFAWADLLTPRGTLAVITHSDSEGPELNDPTSRLVTTLRAHQVGWFDHIILLEAPLDVTRDQSAATGCSPLREVRACDEHSGYPVPVRHRRVHSDLLLFTAQAPALRTDGGMDDV
jgi:hypothetical protein